MPNHHPAATPGITSLEVMLLGGMVVMLIIGGMQLWKGDRDRAERNAEVDVPEVVTEARI